MAQYFDKTFFKFAAGFLVILCVSIACFYYATARETAKIEASASAEAR